MFQGNLALSAESAAEIADGTTAANVAATRTTSRHVFQLLFHVILVISSIIYMRLPDSDTTVPWVLNATPFVTGYCSRLTIVANSFHLYSLGRAVLLAVVVYALTVWKASGVGNPDVYLNLVFVTVIAS